MADESGVEALTVDDLVSGRVAADLGEGVFPMDAVLVVQSMTEEGPQLRYMRSLGCSEWSAMGMLRSALNHIENEDLSGWYGDDD